MEFLALSCLNKAMFSLVCAFSNPIETDFYKIDSPQYMQTADIKIVTLYENSQRFYPNIPDIGPIALAKPIIEKKIAKKPTKVEPVQQEVITAARGKKRIKKIEDNVILASFAPSKATGLLKLVPKSIEKDNGTLFVKADGNEQTHCLHKDAKLWSAMQKVRKKFGKPLIIESAYRSPAYNAALRKRSKGVAKHSQHMNCKAIDFRVPGVSMRTLQTYVRSLSEIGGVGLYANWVHMDTGSVRNW